MKKSLIALAVAGAMTAPMVAQADATLYGSLRVKIVDEDTSGSSWDMQDNVSRIGVRGKVDTGMEGVGAVFRFEQAVNTQAGAFSNGRLGYVGITTDGGDFLFGRQWSPHYLMASAMVDILDGASNPTNALGRVGETTSYTSPLMGGARVALAVITDDAAGEDENVDKYNLGLKYEMAGFAGAVSFISDEVNDDSDVWSVAASYSMDALYVGAQYTDRDEAIGDNGQWELVGSYDIGNVKLLAQYVDFDETAANVDLGNQATVEAWYKLGKQARTFISYTDHNSDSENNGGNADTLSIGYRVDF